MLTYGWSQIRGSNASLVSLVWPGSFQGAQPDPPNPGTGGGGGGGSTTSAGAETGQKTATGKTQPVPTSIAQAQQWLKSGTKSQKTAGAQYVFANGGG